MPSVTFTEPGPIRAVLFDFHSTLVDQGDPVRWLDLAWHRAGRAGTAADVLGPDGRDELAGWVNRIWEHVREVDPANERDLSPARHREVYDTLMDKVDAIDDTLAHAEAAIRCDGGRVIADRFDATGDLAAQYIVAHEFGHAIQYDQNPCWGGGEMRAMRAYEG